MGQLKELTGIFIGMFLSQSVTMAAVSPSVKPLSWPEIAQNVPREELSLENQILQEINRLRTNPKSYANWLESLQSYYEEKVWKLPKQSPIITQEGVSALNEAIDFLRRVDPLPELKISPTLSTTAQEYLQDTNQQSIPSPFAKISPSSTSTTNDTNESKTISALGQNLVMQLVLDDGFSERPHRNNLFNTAFQVTGIACTEQPQIQCVIGYSSASSENTTESNNSRDKKPLLLQQGILEDGDLKLSSDQSLYDSYPLEGQQDQSLTITLESQDFDPYLAIVDAQGNIIGEQDDISDENKNSQLTITLSADAMYQIIVNSYDPQGRGKYTLTIWKK